MTLDTFKRTIKYGDKFQLTSPKTQTPHPIPDYCYEWNYVISVTKQGIELGAHNDATQVWLCFWPEKFFIEDRNPTAKVTFVNRFGGKTFDWTHYEF